MMGKHETVKGIFDKISGKYDILDSIVSMGMDQHWRRASVRKLEISSEMDIIDCGAGSGKLTEIMLDKYPATHVTALDITDSMFRKSLLSRCRLVVSPAETLPFKDENFDRGVSAFLTRNLADIDAYFSEMYRILRPGGIFANIDIYNPTMPVFSQFFSVYFYHIVPFIGNRATDSRNYTYLANSVRNFYPPEIVKLKLEKAGFRNVEIHDLFFSSVIMHVARK